MPTRIDDLSMLLGKIEQKVDQNLATVVTLQNSFYTDRDIQLRFNSESALSRNDLHLKLDELEKQMKRMEPIVRDYQTSRNRLIGALAVLVFLSGGAGAAIGQITDWLLRIWNK